MKKHPLCIGLGGGFGIPVREQIPMIKNVGFDGFFTGWQHDDVQNYRRLADEYELIYQSIHAPYTHAADMWRGGEAAAAALDELTACLYDCAAVHVPILVLHAFIGFDEHSPSEVGVKNYVTLCREAERLGVTLAFENTEGEEYLAAIMGATGSCKHVGFCWDTGHELCYNGGRDMCGKYADRLVATHINDNLGSRDPNHITWRDDLHLLPFDGNVDFSSVASRLASAGYGGELTFELLIKSKPDRHENNAYAVMPLCEYFAEAYRRALHVRTLVEKCEE